MYLFLVYINTRFDVQLQIWITNNIQKLVYCYRQIIIHTRFGLFNRLLLHSWTFRAQSARGYIISYVHILWQKFPEKLWMHIFIFFSFCLIVFSKKLFHSLIFEVFKNLRNRLLLFSHFLSRYACNADVFYLGISWLLNNPLLVLNVASKLFLKFCFKQMRRSQKRTFCYNIKLIYKFSFPSQTWKNIHPEIGCC